MIDWTSLIINSFWVLGLAIILAAFSYHHWAAHEAGRSLREQLNQNSFQFFAWLGFTLVAVGLAGTSRQTWEMVVWILFALAGAFYAWQSRPTAPPSPDNNQSNLPGGEGPA